MQYTKEINKKENSEIEIKGEIKAEDFSSLWPKAIKRIGAEVKIDGFRPGHIPEKILVDKVGEEKILWEMAEEAIGIIYPKILEEEKIPAIGRPNVSITKIAKDNPLGFSITTAVLPEFDLPDYQKIAEETLSKKPKEKNKVTDEELNKFLENIRQAHQEKDETGKPAGDLPEINDDFIKKFGDFATVEDFKKTIKEQLQHEKETKEKEKVRIQILETIAEKTKIEIPEILIQGELNKMWQEMSGQISSMGLKIEDYLKHLKKTKEDLEQDWRDDAIKRVKLGLIMQKIAVDAKIIIPSEEIEKQTESLLSRLPQSPKTNKEAVRNYVENSLINEKVLALLEKSDK